MALREARAQLSLAMPVMAASLLERSSTSEPLPPSPTGVLRLARLEWQDTEASYRVPEHPQVFPEHHKHYPKPSKTFPNTLRTP